jgi:hypothetical protein
VTEQDPTVEDPTVEGEGPRTREMLGQADDEPVAEDGDQPPAREEGREGGGVIEERIEEVKRKAREMAEGENRT